jgi:hypothetical protein
MAIGGGALARSNFVTAPAGGSARLPFAAGRLNRIADMRVTQISTATKRLRMTKDQQ